MVLTVTRSSKAIFSSEDNFSFFPLAVASSVGEEEEDEDEEEEDEAEEENDEEASEFSNSIWRRGRGEEGKEVAKERGKRGRM